VKISTRRFAYRRLWSTRFTSLALGLCAGVVVRKGMPDAGVHNLLTSCLPENGVSGNPGAVQFFTGVERSDRFQLASMCFADAAWAEYLEPLINPTGED